MFFGNSKSRNNNNNNNNNNNSNNVVIHTYFTKGKALYTFLAYFLQCVFVINSELN